MERALYKHLSEWLVSTDRLPLVIRGARQVGKTWLVRHLAEQSGRRLIELNFEKNPSYTSLFASNDPSQILLNLSAALNQDVDPDKCILFLDEIQAAPELFSKLRWFAEDLKTLPVIAAGSLLEFVLADHAFSMPVGRISYMYLEPMSFEEFLLASDKKLLCEYLQTYNMGAEIPKGIHEQCLHEFREYILVGGMPAVVLSWVAERSLSKVNQKQNDLLATHRDDFARYRGRIAIDKLDEVMMSIPKMLGQKFVYSRVSSAISSATAKQVLDLLEKARVVHRVQSCAANGLPLGAEIRDKYFKEIFLDIGLCSAALGLGFTQVTSASEIVMVNNGGVAEQVAGQILRTINPPYLQPALYYWHRDEVGSNAEVDYVIQHANRIVPVEVKAGSSGSMKSLHLFMGLRKLSRAVRINSDYPSITNVDVVNSAGEKVKYHLLSIPFYLAGQLNRLLACV